MIALGCKINACGSSEVALEYRCKIAENKYWASREEYSVRTPLRERCMRLAQQLLPVVLHCGVLLGMADLLDN